MSTAKPGGRVRGFQFSAWNLLLLILVTPLFNFDEPRLFGLPFFYWFQLAFVVLGVLCTGIVYLATRNKPCNQGQDELSVDDLDEGEAR